MSIIVSPRTARLLVAGFLLALAPGFAGAEPIDPLAPKEKEAATEGKPSSQASKNSTPKTRELPLVVVTAATRNTQPLDTTATSVSVITHEESTQQHYANIVDALTRVPGLTLGQHGTPGQLVSVFSRGTDNPSTLLTIDGRRQAPDISNFYDFANLTLDDVDQVEFVRTPSSAMQGGNSIGGVINLVTLSGRGLDGPQSSVGFEAGSFDTFRETAQSRGAEGNFDYGVAFSRQDSHYPRANNDYQNSVYRGNYGYQIAPKIYFDLQTSYTQSNAASPGSTQFPDPTAELFREAWNISPRVKAEITDFYTTTFYYNRSQLRQVYDDPLNVSHNRTQLNTDSIDWQNDLQLAHNWRITTGIQGDRQLITDQDDVLGVRDIQNTLANVGGYIQSQWEPLRDFHVITAVRYDDYSDYKNAFSWRQGVSYRTPVTRTLLHASISSAYRPPSVAELYFPPFGIFPTSNPNLVPEKSIGYEVGAEQPLWKDRLTARATYFHNNITNFINSNAATNFVPFNIGRATTDGVELGLDAQPIDRVRLNVNYTYLNAVDDVAHVRLAERPRHTFNFTGTYTPLDCLVFGAGGTWVVDRESSAGVNQEDYFVLRLSGTWQINPTVSIWVRGENVLNESYAVFANYPALGAGGYGGVKVSF